MSSPAGCSTAGRFVAALIASLSLDVENSSLIMTWTSPPVTGFLGRRGNPAAAHISTRQVRAMTGGLIGQLVLRQASLGKEESDGRSIDQTFRRSPAGANPAAESLASTASNSCASR